MTRTGRTRTNVLILGGGSGGLELAAQLADQDGIKVTLVDRDAVHVWKPRLHELAAGTVATSLAEMSFYLLGQFRGFRFEQGSVEALDRAAKTVRLAAMKAEDGHELAAARELSYDLCVVALGGTTPDFGTEGVATHAIRLDRKEDADRFRHRFIACMTHARETGVPAEIVIVGTGPTGIELAAHLRDAEHGFIDPQDGAGPGKLLGITLVEAAPELMPGVSDDLRGKVAERLRTLDIKIVTDAEVAEIDADAIVTNKGERWPSDLCVWATGLVGNPALKRLGELPLDAKGRIEVDRFLRMKDDANVYVLGDSASMTPQGSDKPLPPTAQAASQQAAYLADAIPKALKGSSLKPFEFTNRGRLLSIGSAGSVGKLGPKKDDFLVAGQFAGAAYHALERQHQWRVLGRLRGSVAILADLLSPAKGPSLKLHGD